MPDNNQNSKISLSRRKILAGTGAIGASGLAAGLGSQAFFNDSEQIGNNQLVAGELDLKVGWEVRYFDWIDSTPQVISESDLTDDPGPIVQLEDVKPGDVIVHTLNARITGNPAFLSIDCSLTDSDNGITEPEDMVDGDLDGSDGTPGGDLGDALRAVVWFDDGDGLPQEIWAGDFPDTMDEFIMAVGDAGQPSEVFDLDSPNLAGAGTAVEMCQDSRLLDPRINGHLADEFPDKVCYESAETESIGVLLWVPNDIPGVNDNIIQTDRCEYGIRFSAVQCRHNVANDGTPVDGFPTAVASAFLDSTAVAEDSLVFMVGPLDPGTVFGDYTGAHLQVPDDPGTYYAFLIDEDPSAGYGHPVRFAWFDADTGATDVTPGSWWPQFSSAPQFDLSGPVRTVRGRRFVFGNEPRQDVPPNEPGVCIPKNVGVLQNGDQRLGDGVSCPKLPDIPTTGDDFSDPTNLNYALVLDGGLPGGAAVGGIWDSSTMAAWGEEAKEWIEDQHAGDNFNVQRISQHPGKTAGAAADPPSINPDIPSPFESLPAAGGGATRAPSPAYRQLERVFAAYEEGFVSAQDEVDIAFGMHFVLVVFAHGDFNEDPPQDDGVFMLSNPGAPNSVADEYAIIPWRGGITFEVDYPGMDPRTISYDAGIREWLASFPDWVEVTFIAFSCYSGEADNAVGPAAEYVVTSANAEKVSKKASVDAFFRAGRLLSDKYDAMRRVKNEGEQRRPDTQLGPLDE